MNPHLADELAALGRLTVAGLRSRYAELFGEPTRTGNKNFRQFARMLPAKLEIEVFLTHHAPIEERDGRSA
jgi:hypothetical protein